jgi:hypothetical protein
VITQLHPSAKALSADLKQTAKVAPDFRGFFVGFKKVAQRGPAALGAVRQLLGVDLPPLFTQLTPFLRQLTPIVTGAHRYQSEITGLLGNATGATEATSSVPENNNLPLHYLRTSGLLSPDAISIFPNHRLTTNRANPYFEPGGALKVASGLQSFGIDACPGATRVTATFPAAADATFNARFPAPPNNPTLFDLIKKYAFSDKTNSANVPAPPCVNQGPQSAIGQIPALDPSATSYLHVYPNP